MGSENKSLNCHHHDHGAHHEPRSHTPPKLSLLVSPRTSMLPEAPTPPPRTTTVSVPFQWEEAPGKPRPCHTRSEPKGSDVARALELPPRLMFLESKASNSMLSPTTVLDGPYVGRATSFTSSYRTPKESNWNANFGSSRWSGMKKKDGEDPEGSFDFSSWTEDCTSTVKITRVRRRGSFSQARSHLWASIYESFKQVVPWRRRQERQRKCAPKMDTV